MRVFSNIVTLRHLIIKIASVLSLYLDSYLGESVIMPNAVFPHSKFQICSTEQLQHPGSPKGAPPGSSAGERHPSLQRISLNCHWCNPATVRQLQVSRSIICNMHLARHFILLKNCNKSLRKNVFFLPV